MSIQIMIRPSELVLVEHNGLRLGFVGWSYERWNLLDVALWKQKLDNANVSESNTCHKLKSLVLKFERDLDSIKDIFFYAKFVGTLSRLLQIKFANDLIRTLGFNSQMSLFYISIKK